MISAEMMRYMGHTYVCLEPLQLWIAAYFVFMTGVGVGAATVNIQGRRRRVRTKV